MDLHDLSFVIHLPVMNIKQQCEIILIAASIVSSQGSERSVRSYQFRTDKDPVLIAFHGEKYEQRTPALESGM